MPSRSTFIGCDQNSVPIRESRFTQSGDLAITLKTPAANPVSIRRVLLRWLLAPLIGLFTIAGIQSYSAAVYLATQAYDGALLDTALSLFNVMVEMGNKEELTYSEAQDIMLRTDQFDKIYYSVRDTH